MCPIYLKTYIIQDIEKIALIDFDFVFFVLIIILLVSAIVNLVYFLATVTSFSVTVTFSKLLFLYRENVFISKTQDMQAILASHGLIIKRVARIEFPKRSLQPLRHDLS